MNHRLQRGIIMVPSALTLSNLFFGFWAIISATRGHFETAAWMIVFAALADTVDGRVARLTKTGSKFGEELDSLSDAISFGVAPSLIIYYLFLAEGTWGWVASFFFTSSAVVRLARFNVEQAGQNKSSFHGLPSPSAGITLAAFYPFSQTDFFKAHLATLPWPNLMAGLMIILGMLMMSHVLYPMVPKFGFRSARGVVTFLAMLVAAAAAIAKPALVVFPALFGYVAFGVLRSVVLGHLERLPERDPMVDEEGEGDEADAEVREIEYADLPPQRRARARWQGTGNGE